MAKFIYLFTYIVVSICSSDAYKALIVTQMPSKSHSILNNAIVKQLLKEGHEVTYVRSIEYKNAPPNLRQIDVSSNKEILPANAINIQAIMDNSVSNADIEYVRRFMTAMSVKTVENVDVQTLLNDPKERFDVIIVEYMYNDFLASLAAVFDCPLIWLSPMEVHSDILKRIDAVPNPAYVIDSMSTDIVPLTFKQRVQQLLAMLKSEYLFYRHFDDIETEAYNRLITPIIAKRGREPPLFRDVRDNVSLVLGYSHVSLGEAINLPQMYKSVGGFHIDEDVKSLPQDLKEIMDNANKGVIYFSMGSNLRSKDWPEEIKQKLLQMFGELEQTVLWKFEEQLPNIPKNVYISNWFPQWSILAHPNSVIFITHGGLLSITESLHFGVPVIGIPAFADQFVNIKRAVKKGFGKKVDMTYNVAENLKIAITEIISNPLYRLKAKEASMIFHDRPAKAIDELSFWVQHVVKTRGAKHLRSPAFELPLYKRLYLDLTVLVFMIVTFIYKMLRVICSFISNKIMKSKEKNN